MSSSEDKIISAFKEKDWNEIQASDSWKIFKIMSEFVEGFEKLARIGPCVSIFGSARTGPDNDYFRLAEVRGVFEELDQWLRHHLRCILWRQWKRAKTRGENLIRLGLEEERAWRSATNGRGPWWNAGASHMNQALPRKYFDVCGLVSLLDQLRKLQCAT